MWVFHHSQCAHRKAQISEVASRGHVMYYIQHLICHYVQKRKVSLLTGLVFQEEQMPNSEQIGKQAALAQVDALRILCHLSRCTDANSCMEASVFEIEHRLQWHLFENKSRR
ncbi:hypothetical protein AVEN_177761-1 [Araneus ventricosus]|uniref:Uncharacterized protein n=1 Tax=Araneus ventricosus TaxID=182803 RepID=A0A4Y2NLW6_ARAVE|nr:hypothetical protein AVEN_210365-1 [Araneus ventricosus]GBN40291.1 hypothetical protein AVEN_177761-1 [Araneus ventricosus]